MTIICHILHVVAELRWVRRATVKKWDKWNRISHQSVLLLFIIWWKHRDLDHGREHGRKLRRTANLQRVYNFFAHFLPHHTMPHRHETRLRFDRDEIFNVGEIIGREIYVKNINLIQWLCRNYLKISFMFLSLSSLLFFHSLIVDCRLMYIARTLHDQQSLMYIHIFEFRVSSTII